MFEAAEVGNKLDKETYKTEGPGLRAALLEAQTTLRRVRRCRRDRAHRRRRGRRQGRDGQPAARVDGRRAASRRTASGPQRRGARAPADVALLAGAAAAGQASAIFFGSWYTAADRRPRRSSSIDAADVRPARSAGSVDFERMLTDEGVLVLKFWLHLSKKQQKKRLEAARGRPASTRWRVTKRDWKFFKHVRRLPRRLASAAAPDQHRRRAMARRRGARRALPQPDRRRRILLEALEQRLAEATARHGVPARSPAAAAAPSAVNVLDRARSHAAR